MKRPLKVRRKISIGNRRAWKRPEVRKAHAKSIGWHLPKSACLKISKALKGRVPWNKGKKATKKSRIKMSLAHLGKSNGCFGRKFTKASLKKMSKSKKGKITKKDGRWKYFENKLKKQLQNQGWEIHEHGWPDFVCLRQGKIRFIEVKGLGWYKGPLSKKEIVKSTPLPKKQQFIHELLKKFGIKVEVIYVK